MTFRAFPKAILYLHQQLPKSLGNSPEANFYVTKQYAIVFNTSHLGNYRCIIQNSLQMVTTCPTECRSDAVAVRQCVPIVSYHVILEIPKKYPACSVGTILTHVRATPLNLSHAKRTRNCRYFRRREQKQSPSST